MSGYCLRDCPAGWTGPRCNEREWNSDQCGVLCMCCDRVFLFRVGFCVDSRLGILSDCRTFLSSHVKNK